MADRDLLDQQRQALNAFLQAEDKRSEIEQEIETARAKRLSEAESSFRNSKAEIETLLNKSCGNFDRSQSQLSSIKLEHLLAAGVLSVLWGVSFTVFDLFTALAHK